MGRGLSCLNCSFFFALGDFFFNFWSIYTVLAYWIDIDTNLNVQNAAVFDRHGNRLCILFVVVVVVCDWWLFFWQDNGEEGLNGEGEDTIDSDFSLSMRSQSFAMGPPKVERSQVYGCISEWDKCYGSEVIHPQILCTFSVPFSTGTCIL